MSNMNQPPVEGLMEPKPKKGHGCFFWGCLVAVILLVFIGGCTGILGYYAYNTAKNLTSTQPQPIPKHDVRPGEYEGLQKKIAGFTEVAGEEKPARLELTADDFNTLIAKDPNLQRFIGKAFVRIEGDQLSLEVSIPLDDIPLMGGRYFNGSIALKASLENGRLVVDPQKVTLAGKQEMQPELLKGLGEVLTQAVNDQQSGKLHEFLQKAKSLEVKNGKVILER